MQKNNQLSQLEFFQGLSAETLEYLWKNGRVMDYSKGTVLMRAKEPTGFVYFQLTGKSIMYNLTHHGKRKILFVFGKGALLNEHIFNDHTTSIYCETIEKSKLFIISSSEFIKMMKEDFELTKRVLESQEKKMWRLTHQLKNTMSSIYLERKLASKLWKLSRDFGFDTKEGREIDINMTITFLADMLGVPRESTSRVCSVLVDHGLIKMQNRRIVILDIERLVSFYRTGKFS